MIKVELTGLKPLTLMDVQPRVGTSSRPATLPELVVPTPVFDVSTHWSAAARLLL